MNHRFFLSDDLRVILNSPWNDSQQNPHENQNFCIETRQPKRALEHTAPTTTETGPDACSCAENEGRKHSGTRAVEKTSGEWGGWTGPGDQITGSKFRLRCRAAENKPERNAEPNGRTKSQSRNNVGGRPDHQEIAAATQMQNQHTRGALAPGNSRTWHRRNQHEIQGDGLSRASGRTKLGKKIWERALPWQKKTSEQKSEAKLGHATRLSDNHRIMRKRTKSGRCSLLTQDKNKTNQRNPNLISVKSKPKETAQTRSKMNFLLKLNTIHIFTEVTALPVSFNLLEWKLVLDPLLLYKYKIKLKNDNKSHPLYGPIYSPKQKTKHPHRCTPCCICHLHTMRQANTILQMKQR
jgi:hypothetical protein